MAASIEGRKEGRKVRHPLLHSFLDSSFELRHQQQFFKLIVKVENKERVERYEVNPLLCLEITNTFIDFVTNHNRTGLDKQYEIAVMLLIDNCVTLLGEIAPGRCNLLNNPLKDIKIKETIIALLTVDCLLHSSYCNYENSQYEAKLFNIIDAIGPLFSLENIDNERLKFIIDKAGIIY